MSLKWLHITVRSLRLICRCRLRSALALLAASLGITGVICSVNYTAGGRKQVLDQIYRLGTNVIVVSARQSRAVAGRARTGQQVTTLVERDYSSIRLEIPSVVESSALVRSNQWMKAGSLSKNGTVVGCEPGYFKIKDWSVADGSLFDQSDVRRSARVAVLGQTARHNLFGTESPIGQRMLIDRVPFAVVGVLDERGQGLDAANEDDQVYVPLSAAMHRLMSVDYYNALFFEIQSLDGMDDASRDIATVLGRRHKSTAMLQEDFQVQNQKELIDTALASNERLSFFLGSAAFSGLVVSGFGILAISWISLRERTVELGTTRAIGATPSDVFFQIAFEATVFSLIGSGIGLGAGWAGSAAIAAWADIPLVFDWPNARLALIAASLMNLAFAFIPSSKAALLDPVFALKHE